jgi:hypothetical protein
VELVPYIPGADLRNNFTISMEKDGRINTVIGSKIRLPTNNILYSTTHIPPLAMHTGVQYLYFVRCCQVFVTTLILAHSNHYVMLKFSTFRLE